MLPSNLLLSLINPTILHKLLCVSWSTIYKPFLPEITADDEPTNAIYLSMHERPKISLYNFSIGLGQLILHYLQSNGWLCCEKGSVCVYFQILSDLSTSTSSVPSFPGRDSAHSHTTHNVNFKNLALIMLILQFISNRPV